MKLKNFIELLGFRKSARRYGYRVKDIALEAYPALRFAQWLHPGVENYQLTQQTIDQLGQYIQRGDFCIDIGAHCGDSTLPMAINAGPEGCVLALEPNPFVFPVLEKNVRLNRDVANMVAMLAAAGKDEGAMQFEYSDAGFCNGGRHENISALRHGHPYKLSVHAVNLSKELREDFSEALPKLSFIKVDAEGYDLYVLQAIEDIIDEFRPTVKTEVFKRTDAAYREALVTFFLSKGYRVNKIVGEPCLTGESLAVSDVMKWAHYDILCRP